MRALGRVARLLSLILLSVLGTSALMYCAPGYFADAREMDAAHADRARADLNKLRAQQTSLPALLHAEVASWSHGDLGLSRQFGVPVGALLQERGLRSVRLLMAGVLLGWSLALLFALPLSLRRGRATTVLIAGGTALLLAVPVGALATFCLLANTGGPVLVLAVVIAVRDFKLLHRVFADVWRAPYLLHARAQGLSSVHILRTHMLPTLRRELLSLAVMSFTLALSALVPVEVVFDVAGLGHLAWSAAMNRDLPVLVAVTSLVAACVGVAGFFVEPARATENAQCA